MYQGSTLHLRRIEPGVAELCFDRRDGGVNKLDGQTIDELGAAVAAIAALAASANQASHIEGVLLTSARDSFIVGADIFEFSALFGWSEDRLAGHIGQASAVFSALADLGVPTVAAINGAALGGGLEVALATDYRVMADSAVVGLPEVTLGIFPGYGGTVRLPRLAGMACALDWIVSGAPRRAEAARDAGAVDLVAPAERLRVIALALLHEAIQGKEDWRARRKRHQGPAQLDQAALDAAIEKTRANAGHYPAALAAAELIGASAALPRDGALALEARAFARIARTPTAAALVGTFMNEQALKKKTRAYAAAARPVGHAAILGAGIMGGGIAYQNALRGTPVLMKDIAQGSLDIGMGEARKLLAKQVAGGRMAQAKADQVLGAITPTLDYQGFDQADVVIEAVVENLGVKRSVLAEVERQCRDGAIIASNTSSLPIGSLSGALQRPQQFIGMHFFNPVPVMALVEVIPGPATSAETVATTVAYASAMGKTPIVVQDCPGFLVNRILTAYLLGFAGLVRDGADFRQVDAALEAFGWPMGPAYLQDVIGMDTARHVVDIIAAGYPERMSGSINPAALLADQGRLGQKNGVGFYRYENDPRGKPRKAEAADTPDLLAPLQAQAARPFSAEEIVDRTMLPMLIEAALCLETGVVGSAAELDMAILLGLGFPRHIGGILAYANRLGLAEVVRRCDALAAAGALYTPSAQMRSMAATNACY